MTRPHISKEDISYVSRHHKIRWDHVPYSKKELELGLLEEAEFENGKIESDTELLEVSNKVIENLTKDPRYYSGPQLPKVNDYILCLKTIDVIIMFIVFVILVYFVKMRWTYSAGLGVVSGVAYAMFQKETRD